MEKSEIIILQSAYNKTPGQKYYIQPCKDPATGEYPSCVREVLDERTHQMILSETDKEDMKKGVVLLPASKPIVVQHGTTFDLSVPRQRAEWEAIKNSSMIAKDRFEKNADGTYVVDGEKPYETETGVIRGRFGKADLYIFRPGVAAKNRNSIRELVFKATDLVLHDPAGLSGWITKCKLLEKNMAHANKNDIEDYLLTQAEKYPEKIIELYTGTKTSIRLLIIEAMNKNVIIKRGGILYYADDVVLGGNLDAAVTFLSQQENNNLRELIKRDTFPELNKKNSENENPTKENDSEEDSGSKNKSGNKSK